MKENKKQPEPQDDPGDIDLRRLLKNLEDPKRIAEAQARVREFSKKTGRNTDHENDG